MADWYEQPYPGGKMVAVKGFPRPLYPPDAAPGHTPSVDGSDVEAYKRVVSRAGRWKWQEYDQAFSNGFAHGTSGNVIDSGVAGVQRQQKIAPDTGFVGKDTFNLFRSIRIPDGLPNAGQPAMDARAVELINAAYSRFGGSEPVPEPPPPLVTSAQARLTRARTEIGTHESPFGSNRQKFGAWYGFNGVPWCAIFATWADCTSTKPSGAFARGSRYSYVPDIVSYARRGINGFYITGSPRPGDLVCFDWGRDGQYDHIGIFESGSPSSFKAIEGNTGAGNNSNGGQVLRTERSRSMASIIFVRVREP